MTWADVIDSYCERTDAGYWSEPLNALSNLSFIVVAVVTWRMARAADDRPALLLALSAGSIGLGSYLFHTHATRWALQADVWPIRVFVLLFIGFAVVRFFHAPWWAGMAAAAGFVLATVATLAAAGVVGFTANGSIGYAPIPAAMALMAVLVARRDRRAALGMLLGAATFVLSLALRTVDRELCASLPLGTHVGWHLLNGVVIATMIVVFIGRGRVDVSAQRRSPGSARLVERG
ncbi:ceramidase domain-containing protein [Nocardioides dongkuii]|uniref:ceramidase domain-containing protein n=1 Tax=Nocardioides dongkuii TaxID=2760089 RepID=UPI0015FB99C4|nr:ceramidase domain-containing protein [Nocardioides dongkuii]